MSGPSSVWNVASGADAETSRPAAELLHERLVQIARDVDPLDARTRLAAVGEGAPERALDRSVEVGILEDEHRVLAAELERDRAETLACGGRDFRTDVGGAREEDLRDPARADELLAGGRIPLHDAHEPRRRARLLERALHPAPRERRELGRLDHDRVPGGHGRDRLRERDPEREVPRRDHRDGAVGLVQEPAALVTQVRLREAHPLGADDLLGVGGRPR